MSDYLPDPIERMDARIESMADMVFGDVPAGKARCMGCQKIVDEDDLYAVSAHPDSPVGCGDCVADTPAAGPACSEPIPFD